MAERATGYETLRRLCAVALRGEGADAVFGPDSVFAAQGLALAERHRVVPLLAAGLAAAEKHAGAPAIAFREALRRRALALAQQTVRLERELGAIESALRAADVEFLVLKGPALARQAYDPPEWRVYDDLDLWIHSRDFDGALAALAGAGYRRQPPLGVRAAACARRAGIDVALAHPDHGRLIELAHGPRPTAPSLRAAHDVWTEAVALDVGGVRVRAPRAVHALLLACRHGAHHRWDRLAWVADVAGLWRRLSPGEREDVAGTARRWRVETMAGLGLRLAAEAFGIQLEGAAVALAERPRAIALAREVGLEKIAGDSLRVRVRDGLIFNGRAQDSAGRRMGSLARALFVPTGVDLQAFPLPPGLYPLYALLRPLRLLYLCRRPAGPA